MGWKVAAYLRVSSDIQAGNNGTAVQREAIERWVQYHNAQIEGVRWFEDLALSGSSMERPQFAALQQAIDAGECDTVVAYDLSRVGRNTRGVLDFVEKCAKEDVRLVSIKENIDMGTSMGKFFLTILSAMNELQRSMIVDRVRDGQIRRARSGERMGLAAVRQDYNVPPVEVQQAIAAEYGQGAMPRALAEKYGVLPRQVYRYAQRFPEITGVRVESRRFPESRRAKRGRSRRASRPSSPKEPGTGASSAPAPAPSTEAPPSGG